MPLPMVNRLFVVLDLATATGGGTENTNARVKLWGNVGGVEVRRAWEYEAGELAERIGSR
jgi:hypothetical protein